MDMKNIQQKDIHFQTATFIQFYSGIGHRLLTGLISDKKTAFKRLKQPVGRCNTHLCRDLRRLDRDIPAISRTGLTAISPRYPTGKGGFRLANGLPTTSGPTVRLVHLAFFPFFDGFSKELWYW